MRIGSLFDGIGGFPLAAAINGMTPVWASEIESFPMRVTAIRFPKMLQLGDITKINGAEIDTVDIISFGSPCQDLSVAGKRAGLDGERSGLFGEAIRIIREMRSATGGKFPRFAVWENVPGAFSSNNGQDFRAVIESLCRVVEESREIPMPRLGKWATAGMVTGEGYSVAWRVLDAQYWGVPQRRRRIYAVADFGGQCAGKILFEREGVRRYFTQGRSKGEGFAGSTESVADGAIGFKGNASIADSAPVLSEKVPTLQTTAQMCAAFKQGNSATARSIGYEVEKSPTLTSGQSGTNLVPAVIHPTVTGTLCASGAGMSRPAGMASETDLVVAYKEPIPIIDKATRYKGGGDTRKNDGSGNGLGVGKPGDPAPTLTAGDRHAVAYSPEVLRFDHSRTPSPSTDVSIPLRASSNPSSNPNGSNSPAVARIGYKVRRLTPLECERLQGYPDGWTGIEKASDTARYKALGNSVAIPCVEFVLGGIAETLRSVSGNA